VKLKVKLILRNLVETIMVKKKNKESSPAVNISTDLKKTEETTTTQILSHV